MRVKATNEKQPHAVCARPDLVESRRADEPAASLAMNAPFAMALIVYFFVAGLTLPRACLPGRNRAAPWSSRIAWFDERTLLILLLTRVLLAVFAVFFVLDHRRGTKATSF